MSKQHAALPPRKFGIALAVFIAAVFGLLFPWLGVFPFQTWLLYLAAALAALALAWPAAVVPLQAAWTRIGAVLGWINTRLLLGVVFFGVLFPVALVRRLLSKREPPPGDDSYRIQRSAERDPQHFERPF